MYNIKADVDHEKPEIWRTGQSFDSAPVALLKLLGQPPVRIRM